ncbi:MAG: hypothetical protein MSJ26_04505 [Oscillospiraceae bacterium]|nr:hypothetical protein [Oscillospiraceae bacterium]
MNQLTKQNEIASLISDADISRKKIAAVSDILFRLSHNDPTVKICDTLTIAALSLETEDIPDVGGIKRYIYLARVLERIDETEERLKGFQNELNESLTELYKNDELLRTLSEQLKKENDILLSFEKVFNEIIGSDASLSDNEKQLLQHGINDLNMSRMVAAKNQQLIELWNAKNSSLISGIQSIGNTLLPLWRSQLSEARMSCSADDIRRSFETGRLTAERLLSFVKK